MGNSRRGAIPSELSWLIDELASFDERLDTLEAPSGENLANAVAKLTDIVTNLQTYLDDYIANDLPGIVTAEVAAQLAAAFAGNVTIGGELHVGGRVFFPTAPTRVFVVEPRAIAWLDTSTGELGRT